MNLLNNLETEPFQAKKHDRSQTIDICTRLKNENLPIPIQQHFKIFLISQSSELKKIKNSQRIKIFHRSNKQINKPQKPHESTQKFDCISKKVQTYSGSRKNTIERTHVKDKSQSFFIQFCKKNHRKMQFNNIQSKLQNSQQDQQSVKIFSKQKQKIKSFGSFLENIKGFTYRPQNNQRRNKSIFSVQKNEQSQLEVEGNHKQLRKKPLRTNKKLNISNNKFNKSISVDQKGGDSKLKTTNNKTVNSKQDSHKSILLTKKKNNKASPTKINSLRSSQGHQSSSKTANRIYCGYKNFYSPFNGIQIRYISYQNQDFFQKVNVTLENKNQNLAISALKKPSNRLAMKKTITPCNIQKGIIFRYREPNNNKIQQSIQGWKVQSFEDVNNDLCNQF